jgi:hypothetical protein
MESISAHVRKAGFDLNLVERLGEWGIYRQSKPGINRDSFELVRIRIARPTVLPGGVCLPEREIYPPSESWGVDGFTFTTEEDARRKLESQAS